MFTITAYSLLTTLLVSNFFFILFICLSKSDKVLLQTSLRIFAIIGVLLLIRVFMPVEIGFTNEMVSYEIYPTVLDILNKPICAYGSYCIDLKTILMLIWFVVAAFLLYHRIKCYRSFVRGFAFLAQICERKFESTLAEVKIANHYEFPTTLIVHESIDSVMEFGLFQQTILLPDAQYSERELQYILHHELEHFANKTNWIKLFITILEVVFWWNPLVYLFKNATSHLLEIYCDHSISKRFSEREKLEYLECLLQEAKREYAVRARKKSYNISNFSFGSQLKQRFHILLEGGRNKLLESMIYVLVLGVFVLSYSIVIQPGYAPPSVNFNNVLDQQYDIRFEDGKYVVYIENTPLIAFDTKEALQKAGFIITEGY